MNERDYAAALVERGGERQSNLLLFVVGACALFWGVVYLLIV